MTKNTDCYARSLNDCDGGISKEHYISKSVLEIGQDDLSSIELGGALAAVSYTHLTLPTIYSV